MDLNDCLSSFKDVLDSKELAGAVLFRPQRILYFTNFFCSSLSTERPIALIVPLGGEPVRMVLKLEEEHLQLQAPWSTNIFVYGEFPGRTHPIILFAEIIKKISLNIQPLGVDHGGFLDQNSYKVPLPCPL